MKLKQKIAMTIDGLTATYALLDIQRKDAMELLSLLNEKDKYYNYYDSNELINDLSEHLSLLVNYEMVENRLNKL